MGLDFCHVLSDDAHFGDFVCLICQQVIDLDALVTTPCSHCFCKACLEEWVGRTTSRSGNYYSQHAPKCPTCSNDLRYSHEHSSMMIGGDFSVSVQPLQSCQPLAYRVLKKIKVRCPFSSRVGCGWTGDYGDLKEHTLSNTAHQSRTTANETLKRKANEPIPKKGDSNPTGNDNSVRERQLALAQSFKDEGNEQFSAGHMGEAKELYTKALATLSSENEDKKMRATLHSNRAAAWLRLERPNECVQDCNKAVELEPSYLKAYTRKAKALTQLGQFRRAVDLWHEARQTCDESAQKILKKELSKAESLSNLVTEGRAALSEGWYAQAKAAFGKALRDSSAADVVLGAAKADLGLGFTESAMRLSLKIIRASDHVAEGYEVRGACLFLMGDLDGGRKLVNEALRQAPDLTSAQKLRKRCDKVLALVKEARDGKFHRRFEEAVGLYTSAMDAFQTLPERSTLFGILHTERAECYVRLKQHDRALKDCRVVLYAQEDYKDAWLIKLQALHGLGNHEAAKSDAQDLLNKWGSNDHKIRQAHNKADFEVRKLKRPDFYKLLGLSPIASEREIKAAYSQASRAHHPDRYAGDEVSAEERREAAKRYHHLGDALEVLCDDFKRQLYDEGYDQEAIKERIEKAKRTATAL